MVVFVDGENFRQGLLNILVSHGIISDRDEWFKYDVRGLLSDVLGENDLTIKYYASEIKTPKGYQPSQNILLHMSMIKNKMRRWVAGLKAQNIEYIKAGNLKIKEGKPCYKCRSRQEHIQEKGVDVRLALDILEASYNGESSIVVVSSDTDLCPAYHKLNTRGIQITYVCFEGAVNRAVASATNSMVAISASKAEKYFVPFAERSIDTRDD